MRIPHIIYSVLSPRIDRYIKLLHDMEYWSYTDLVGYQEERLKALVRHSYKSVPYYRDLFNRMKLKPNDIQRIEDLQKIPIMNKSTVRNHGIRNFISSDVGANKMLRMSSSGSTGEPFEYFTTKQAHNFNIASNLLGWFSMGYRFGDRYVKIDNSRRKGVKRIQDYLLSCMHVHLDSFSDEYIDNLLHSIDLFQPKYIRSYSAPLEIVLKRAKEKETSINSCCGVNTTGSVLSANLRTLVREVMKCEVFDSYSCEAGATAFECATHSGYHSCMEYAITEAIPFANSNHLFRNISTDLWNYAMPFIRYDTNDVLEISGTTCSCGNKHLFINKILGRAVDFLISSKEGYINPHTISILMKCAKAILEFQVIQKSYHNFIIYYVKDRNIVLDIRCIETKFTELFGWDTNIDWKEVGEIPLTKSQKNRYIIRDFD